MQTRIEKKTDLRKHPRVCGNRAPVRAAWLDMNGVMKMGQARLIDVSEGGLALELPEAPQANSLLRFQCDQFRLYGLGSVRYASGGRGRCVVGLAYAAGSYWKQADETSPQTASALPVQPEQRWDWKFAEGYAM